MAILANFNLCSRVEEWEKLGFHLRPAKESLIVKIELKLILRILATANKAEASISTVKTFSFWYFLTSAIVSR
jgi:uncharacterized membrane protein (DUF106 family)